MSYEDRLARIARNVLTQLRWSLEIMETLETMQQKLADLVAQANEAKADAARQTALTEQAV